MENRIIKFRAWDFDVAEMIYSETPPSFSFWKHIAYSSACLNTLMQFTGLQDSAGNDIYEGDELMYIGTNQSSMIVRFQDGCFVGEGLFNTLPLIDYFKALDFVSIEITGNPYTHTDRS